MRARLTRRRAVVALAILSLAVAGCISASLHPPRLSKGTGPRDVDLYYAVAQRLHAGQAYYDALGGELRSRGYPTRSVFNWRTPLHLEVIAHLPNLDWARFLLFLGAACAIALGVAALCRDKRYGFACVQLPLLCVPLGITAMPHTFLFAEVWSGVLIAMSVGWYALGWRYAGAATGLLALFFRELALPYALIGAFLAYRERRKPEMFVWLAGIAGYLVFLGLHAMAVLSRIPPSNLAPGMVRWIQFGGLPFVITTSRIGLLLAFPYWVAALYVPLAVLGLLGWPNPVASRVTATVGAYLLAFSVVGAPSMNFYWGAVYNPLLAFGATWAVPACRDIVRAALTPAQPSGGGNG
ncbi:MAG TPA: hypothetical protein VN924_17745 [Bryobacteraceae bacterium]|nr:hypothetical protein [Bryobacteraceae bacterium]